MNLLGELGIFLINLSFRLLSSLRYGKYLVTTTFRFLTGTIPIVCLVGIFIGANLVVEAYGVASVIGAPDLVGVFAGVALVREVGPLLTAAMVLAKTGGEVSSEIATMKIREEISALEVMGVDPYSFLYGVRFHAMVIAFPVLLLFGLLSSGLTAFVVSVFSYDLNPSTFFDQFFSLLTPQDLYIFLFKGIFFAILLTPLQCFFGQRAETNPQEVGIATNATMVGGAITIGWANLVVTAFFYGGV